MNYLNSTVVAAAQGSNQDLGDIVRNTTGGQIFTGLVIAVAIIYILGRATGLFGSGNSDS